MSTLPLEHRNERTVWGHDPVEVHDRFWGESGVQPVRLGSRTAIDDNAEGYLLTGPGALATFDIRPLLRATAGNRRAFATARLLAAARGSCVERVVSDAGGGLLRFERAYAERAPLVPVAVTRRPDEARWWCRSRDWPDSLATIGRTRRRFRRRELRLPGVSYDASVPAQRAACVRDIVRRWSRPDAAFPGVRRHAEGVWADERAEVSPEARIVGPLWVGAGREVARGDSLLGPGVLWDAAPYAPRRVFPLDSDATRLQWADAGWPRHGSSGATAWSNHPGKRAFDVLFSLSALALTLPVYPLVMFAIWWEDGYPFFFTHCRETRHGKDFPCFKFRSMRRNAEEIKARLASENEVDGPQFYMRYDPRLTRVGHFIRKTKLDELPQFFNVLAGHMSVVGPRPSPHRENQCCPIWREARLSVRPGITGLWQLNRKRRKNEDFQEWIRYDLEYVENASWRLDAQIIGRTIVKVIRDCF